jgi:hypothetical protein
MMCNIIDRARKSCSATNVALTKSPSKILLNSGAEDTDVLTETFVVEHNFLTTHIALPIEVFVLTGLKFS